MPLLQLPRNNHRENDSVEDFAAGRRRFFELPNPETQPAASSDPSCIRPWTSGVRISLFSDCTNNKT